MRLKVAAVTGLVLGSLAFQAWPGPSSRADEKPGRPRVEYKVVYSTFEQVTTRESREENGKQRIIDRGPTASAEEMTNQFNALAADGWEYAGPLAETYKEPAATGMPRGGVLSLFKRAKP